MDLLNNIYSTASNKTYVYNYGYYYKYNDTYINYIDSNLGLEYIIDYKILMTNLKTIMEKTNNTYYVNDKNNTNYNKLYTNYIKDVKRTSRLGLYFKLKIVKIYRAKIIQWRIQVLIQ